MEQDGMDYNALALRGLMMVLNNNWHAAMGIFTKHKDESIIMAAASTFVMTMEFFMCFSRHKNEMAVQSATETIQRCKDANKVLKKSKDVENVAQYIINEILSSQCQACLSILSVVRASSIISSCWNIKQVWQQHRKLYKELLNYIEYMNRDNKQQFSTEIGSSFCENDQSEGKIDFKNNGKSRLFEEFSEDFRCLARAPGLTCSSSIEAGRSHFEMHRKKTILEFLTISSSITICGQDCSRVIFKQKSFSSMLGLVTFGYGLFLLAIQLLPQSTSLQVLTHLLGFHDNQNEGMDGLAEKLMLSALGESFVAPVSCCILLHCSSVNRPFMVMNHNNLSSAHELPKIEVLLDRLQRFDNCDSLFYYYFKGKFHLIKGELKEATQCFVRGYKTRNDDLKYMCYYENSRTKMLEFNWSEAAKGLEKIRADMAMPLMQHNYVTAISFGAAGSRQECTKLMASVHKHLKSKQKEASEFFSGRISLWFSSKGPSVVPDQEACKLLCYEMLYLWNAFHVCSDKQLEIIIAHCRRHKDASHWALCLLLAGAATRILQTRMNCGIGEGEEKDGGVEKMLIEALKSQKTSSHGAEDHVQAFAAFELGLLRYAQSNHKASREYFLQAKHLDPRHLFFKNKMEIEMDKFFRTPLRRHSLSSCHVNRPQEEQRSKVESATTRSITFRLFGRFFSPAMSSSWTVEGFEETLVQVPSPRKSFQVVEEGDVNSSCGDGNKKTHVTKGCVIQ